MLRIVEDVIRGLVVVTAAATLGGGLPPLPAVAPLPSLRAHGLRVVRQTATDRQPGNPAVGFGSVWVPSSENDIVDRYDARTGALQARIRAGTTHAPVQNEYFDSVAVGTGGVWAASDAGGEVVRIDPSRNAVVRRAPVPGRPGEVAVGPRGVYVSLFGQATVLRLDPGTGRIVRRRDLDGNAMGVAYGAGAVWALSVAGPTVVELDPLTLRVRRRIRIAMHAPQTGGYFSAWWISAGDSAVCVANQQQNGVTRIDTRTGTVVAQSALPFGRVPFSVAADGAACWAVNSAGVFRLMRTETGWSRLPPLGPSAFDGVTAARGRAWVTVAGRNALLAVGN